MLPIAGKDGGCPGLRPEGYHAASLPLWDACICEVPSADPRSELAVTGGASGGAPPGLRKRQVVPELPAGVDAELGEHLVQVVLRGPGADE